MFARFFHDRLDFAADALCRAAEAAGGPIIEGHALVSGEALDTVLRRYAEAHGIADRRAAASDWSKFFFARLIIPALVIQCSSGQRLDLDPASWGAYCREEGTIAHFVFDADPLGPPAPGDASSLVDAVMTPIVTALATDCGLSPRVFASNAAVYYVWALDQLGAQAQITPAQLAPARALLDASTRPDGGRNPFHAALQAAGSGRARRRTGASVPPAVGSAARSVG
ncbi:MAG: siderophore-iron reductase FhuF [Salinisphaera sp.]|uniref:siderophore-iron reductase FhuF n=1 Tax=Salinisphaera sp. TaxID=1914330 RepID=UPI003C7BA863